MRAQVPPSASPTHSDWLARFLGCVHLAPRQVYKRLTIWPLVRDDAHTLAPPTYEALRDALEAGTAYIEEAGSSGSVPHVVACNQGPLDVLVLFGEELRGALQNRVANASFLVPKDSRVTLDVSCVEQGRWALRDRSGRFESAAGTVSHALRRRMHRHVTTHRALGGEGFTADQIDVWDHVAERLGHASVRSATGSWADYAESQRAGVEEASAHFTPVPGQVGFVAAIGDAVVGLEAIGHPVLFARLFRSLLGGYLLDAVDLEWAAAESRGETGALEPEPEPCLGLLDLEQLMFEQLREEERAAAARAADRRARTGRSRAERPSSPEAGSGAGPAADATAQSPRFDAPEPFLEALAAADQTQGHSLGLGLDVRLTGPQVAGCALVTAELVHLTAFPGMAH